MVSINMDDPNLVLDEASQPDIRPQQGLPVLYDLWEEVGFIYRGQSHIRKTPFIYDGMTMPNAVRTISNLEQDGPHRAADLFHDDAYDHTGKLEGWDFVLTREECDDLHHKLCLAGGIAKEKCDTIHYFLGLFGWIAWERHAFKGTMTASSPDPATASIHELVQFNIKRHS